MPIDCNQTFHFNNLTPVAIGAIGGSGSRLVAQLLIDVGFFMGHTLNRSNDNLTYTDHFKRMESLDWPSAKLDEQLFSFINATTVDAAGRSYLASRWGWKEPNTHILIDRLLKRMPLLRYIHVVRNGLDMAHSKNQNQPKLWGAHFLGHPAAIPVSPRYALKYWCAVHRRMENIAQIPEFGKRIFFLDYDQLCRHPKPSIIRLLNFIDVQVDEALANLLSQKVSPPPSLGRWLIDGEAAFDQEDFVYANNFAERAATLGWSQRV